MKIKCPYCFVQFGEENIINEENIIFHLKTEHGRDSESLEQTLESFKQLGLLDIVEDDERKNRDT